METRRLGRSDFQVPVFMLGTGNFGGKGGVYEHRGSTDVAAATRLVDICLDAGLTMFDTADAYAGGASEETLGAAIKGRRGRVLISTKGGMRVGPGDEDVGNTRAHLIEAVEASLTRLGTDVIDLYQLHIYDALVPVEETLGALDDMIRAGKLRHIGVSNFTGWQVMKGLAASDAHGFARYAAHQAYYSLVGRDYESELMPLALDQGVSCVAWSPLGWGRLTGKIRRGSPLPEQSRLHADARAVPTVDTEYLYRVVDALDAVATETGKTVPQIALNWLLARPSVSSIVIGARDEAQLKANLGALGWSLTKEQVAALDAASARPLSYPYWHQAAFPERNPSPV
jgi:aryl-alcohol dehydrogenase (NADP+)